MYTIYLLGGVSQCTRDNYGWTALHYAVYYNNTPAVQLLLDLKHPRNLQSTAVYDKIPEMASALHIAILSHDSALVELLCKQGVSCNLLIKRQVRNKKINLKGYGQGFINLSHMRMGLSALNYQRYCYRFIVSPSCDLCNAKQESIVHYLLVCPYYAAHRILPDLRDTSPPTSLDLLHLPGKRTTKVKLSNMLINGIYSNTDSDNFSLFKVLAKFICKTERFNIEQ